MKKILVLLALFAVCAFATDYNDLIKDVGAGAGAAGASAGIAWVHLSFWGKIFAFLLPIAIIGGIYMMKIEQKDRGWGKLFGLLFVGVVIGVLFYTGILNVEDNLYTTDGCSTKVTKAYLQDIVRVGLSPSTNTFGTNILATGCYK